MPTTIALFVTICLASDRGPVCREANLTPVGYADVAACEAAHADKIAQWKKEFSEVFPGVYWLAAERCGPNAVEGDDL